MIAFLFYPNGTQLIWMAYQHRDTDYEGCGQEGMNGQDLWGSASAKRSEVVEIRVGALGGPSLTRQLDA